MNQSVEYEGALCAAIFLNNKYPRRFRFIKVIVEETNQEVYLFQRKLKKEWHDLDYFMI